ncbi:MAG TPA: DNRLRE domain-containing protein [Planctomycetota bacterium]|nr:DNRLRE domain-containing protein [Planctomycetota bacterium]
MRLISFLSATALSLGMSAADDPLVLKPTDDTFLSVTHTGKPGGRGESKEFQIYGQAKDSFRALIRFDLSSVKTPPTQAILRVFAWNVGTVKKAETIRCHAIVRDWSEKTASWDMSLADDQWVNAGGDWDPVPVAGNQLATTMGGEKGYWLDFDITRLVQAWVAKQRPNFGVVLMLDPGASNEVRCRSKEHGDNAPELKLAWNAKLERGSGMVMGDKLKPFGDPVKMEPVFTTFSLTRVTAGEKFSQPITAKAGVRPYKFTASNLPEGVTLSESGTLAGTVGKPGKYNISVTCAGADNKKANKTLELLVVAPAENVAEKKADEKAGDGKKAPDPAKPVDE